MSRNTSSAGPQEGKSKGPDAPTPVNDARGQRDDVSLLPQSDSDALASNVTGEKEVLDALSGEGDRERLVEVGDTVTYFATDEPSNLITWKIVSGNNDLNRGIINIRSPVAIALLGSSIGAYREVVLPTGKKQLRVVDIEKAPNTQGTGVETESDMTKGQDIGAHNPPEDTADGKPRQGDLEAGDGGAASVVPYNNWSPRSLSDPKSAPPAAVLRNLLDIIEAEGPVVLQRVYLIYARAAGIRRVGKVVASSLDASMEIAIRQGAVILNDELGTGVRLHSIVRLRDTPEVIIRKRGDRNIDEIPPMEIVEVARSIRRQSGNLDRSQLHRQILGFYELVRLTTHTVKLLNLIINRYAIYQD